MQQYRFFKKLKVCHAHLEAASVHTHSLLHRLAICTLFHQHRFIFKLNQFSQGNILCSRCISVLLFVTSAVALDLLAKNEGLPLGPLHHAR